MKKLIIAVMVLLICELGMTSIAGAAANWAKIKDNDGIKSYERNVPGTNLKEYIAVTTIDAKMEVIGEVLRDTPEFPKWISDCVDARIVKRYDRNTFVLYLTLSPPLIEKRDIVLKDEAVYDYENGNAVINFFCTDEVKIPLEKNRTRVIVMEGSYKMEYLGRNKTKFIYKLKVDPAGNIPKRIAYSVMKNYPYDTLKKLKKMVMNNKYAEAAKESEEEQEIDKRALNESVVRKIFSNNMMKAVKDKNIMTSIIASDVENIKSIAASGGAYADVHQAVKDVYFKYIEKITFDKKKMENLKNNKKMIAEIIDLVQTYSEAENETVDSVVVRYTK